MVNRTLSCSTAVIHGAPRWTMITYEDIIKLNFKIRKDELFISWNKWKYIALGYFGNVKQGMLCCLKIILIPNNSSLDSFTIFIIKRTPIWFKETEVLIKMQFISSCRTVSTHLSRKSLEDDIIRRLSINEIHTEFSILTAIFSPLYYRLY